MTSDAIGSEPNGPGSPKSDLRHDRPAESGVIARGTRAMSIAQVASQVSSLGSSVVLARILVPRDFGVVALATVILLFLNQIKDMGTGSAVIQQREVTPALLNAVFYLNLLLGVASSTALFFAAGPIARLAHQPDGINVIRAFAGITFLTSLAQIHHALLRRDLRFKEISYIAVATTALTAAASIVFALLGAGVWSLVIGQTAGTVLNTIMVWIYDEWRPTAHLEARAMRPILSYSLNLFLVNIAYGVFYQTDTIFVSRWLGATALGAYSLAQRVMTYPLSSIADVVNEVTFPAFARSQDDDAGVRAAFLRASGVVALIALPLMAGAAAVAHPLVHVIFGAKWKDLTILIWILGPVGGALAVTGMANQLLLAKGRSDVLLRMGVLLGALQLTAYIVGLHWGLTGLCFASAIQYVLVTPFVLRRSFRPVGLRLSEYGRTLAPVVLITVTMAGVVLLVDKLLTMVVPLVVVLVVGVITGVIVYVGLLVVIKPAAFNDALGTVRARRQPAAPVQLDGATLAGDFPHVLPPEDPSRAGASVDGLASAGYQAPSYGPPELRRDNYQAAFEQAETMFIPMTTDEVWPPDGFRYVGRHRIG